MKKHILVMGMRVLTLATVFAFGTCVTPAAVGDVLPGVAPALRVQAEGAVLRGLDWLAAQQSEQGGWSDPAYPALTALPLWAFARGAHTNQTDIVQKAVDCILAYCVDGGLYEGAIYQVVAGEKGGGLPNYNTAICASALAEINDPRLVPVILKARRFLARSQYLGDKDSLFRGGMGYDPASQRAYADLSNSYLAYEAMWRTARFEDMRQGEAPVKLDWKAAVGFVEQCHNDSDVNSLSWASDDPGEKGGFAYRPDEYRKDAGAYEQNGVVKFRSMPGMSYAGLLSYIYAGVDRDDPRVRTTVAWIRGNWNLHVANRNPELAGKPEQKEGLFYMYNVMTKGLAAYGRDVLPLADGSTINWRNEIIRVLLDAQRDDGQWINENGRYWESNPVLVTSYSLLALQTALAE